ncbi:core-2/I-branching enzyme-domain-containing protein [Entophlyctis helioformis]|nr:core-2/I-branching enzyme-domain-containing protein [Entophlyctis helioformis]
MLLKAQLWLRQMLWGRSQMVRMGLMALLAVSVLAWLLLQSPGGSSPDSSARPGGFEHKAFQGGARPADGAGAGGALLKPGQRQRAPGNTVMGVPILENINEADDPEDDEYVVPVSADRIYAPETVQVLDVAERERIFAAKGFTFCPILNDATFDATVPIPQLGGSVAQVNPDQHTFVDVVDGKAWDIYKSILYHSKYQDKRDPNREELRRLSCYFAAEGNSAYANLTKSRLLVSLEPVNYFKDRIKAIVPNNSTLPTKRRKFLIAYLLMVHEENGFPHVKKLLDTLDDGDAIILIHVDARPKSARLKTKMEAWIAEREAATGMPSNIHLAKYRFSNIWGHSSLVLTQVSGFWELLDMADWDYVINLSNYDYPLKRNADMHRVLSSEKYRNKNFIEYWPQTDDLAERFYRAHIGEADFSSLFHPSGLGVTSWPFPRWRAYKHHQWMIVTPEFIKFLREDRDALNFLAFAEHTYIPDESYFATVLVNSPQFADKVVNDNKRYLRFAGSDAAHPSWLGYKDRYLFPAGEPEPSFFIIRKLNVFGDFFAEGELLAWINANHMVTPAVPGPCRIEDASVRIECLKEYGSKFADNGELVLLPVNRAFLMTAANMRCSLTLAGIRNIVYWSLDLDVHETLLKKGRLSIFLAGFPSTNEAQKPRTAYFTRMMRFKPKVIKMLLDAGFHVWFMDADTIALTDFRRDVVDDRSADVFVALDNPRRVVLDLERTPPAASAGIMYFRQGDPARRLVDEVLTMQAQSTLLDDQDALRKVLARRDLVEASYTPAEPKTLADLGVKMPPRVPVKGGKPAKEVRPAAAGAAGAAGADAAAGKAKPADGAAAAAEQPPRDKADQAVDLLRRGVAPSTSKSTPKQPPIRVKYLDQFEFINGVVLFDHAMEIPQRFDGFKVVHARPLENAPVTLSEWGLWFVDERGGCLRNASDMVVRLREKVAIKAGWRG